MRNTTGTLVQGNIPNSVTTAVTQSDGVTSYSRFKNVKLLYFKFTKELGSSFVSVDNNLSVFPVIKKIEFLVNYCVVMLQLHFVPNSLYTKESVCTFSLNLYVSQQTSTGLLQAFAIIATCAVPVLDMT